MILAYERTRVRATKTLYTLRAHACAFFEYFEKDSAGSAGVLNMGMRVRGRTITSSIIFKEKLPPSQALELLEELARLGDDEAVEITLSVSKTANTKPPSSLQFPAALLRRYIETATTPGRELMLFTCDEEVSSEVAAKMLGVSRPHLNTLLEVEAIPYRRVGNHRRILVLNIEAYRRRCQ